MTLKTALFICFVLFNSTLCFAQNDAMTVAISDKFYGLDTLSSTTPDASAEHIRALIYNSLVKKNEKFDYVGDLAKELKIDYQNFTITFILNDKVKFHNGKDLSSVDAKYTLEALFKSNSYKASSFFDADNGEKKSHILSIDTPDSKTLIIKVRRFELIQQTPSNLVSIPIIPEGSLDLQKSSPIGTGAFKFVERIRLQRSNN